MFKFYNIYKIKKKEIEHLMQDKKKLKLKYFIHTDY